MAGTERKDLADIDGRNWYGTLLDAVAEHPSDPQLSSLTLENFSHFGYGAPQLKFQIDRLRGMNASLEVISERVKSDEKAQKFRNSGNGSYASTGNSVEAAETYTKSIAYALPGSRELALAYANRSAVSFKTQNYEDCLLDIDRSLKNDYPSDMIAKLYARRVRCLVAMNKPQTDVEKALEITREAFSKMDLQANGRRVVEKTLNDKNHMAPKMSTKKKMDKWKPTVQDDTCDIRGATGVAIRYSEEFVRHIVATRDIRTGELIAVIDKYAQVRSPHNCYRECAYCADGTTAGIPCDHCVNVIYCSTTCLNKAWNEYHKIECPILSILLDLQFTDANILAIKITLKAVLEAGSVGKLVKMLESLDSVSDPRVKGFTGNVMDCTKYACIYTLANHAGKDMNSSYHASLMSTFTIYYLATRTEIFGQKYPPDLQVFDKNRLMNFLGVLMMKNSEIVKTTATGDGEFGDNNVAISPFIALCNHSCSGNVASKERKTSYIFTIQPIKAGEQIFDNYGGKHYSRVPKEERQLSLRKQWHFTCNCVACVEDWPILQKLPFALEFPGLSPATRKEISDVELTAWKERNSSMMDGDVLGAKEKLVQLIELLFQHACPCKEIPSYQQFLKYIYGEALFHP